MMPLTPASELRDEPAWIEEMLPLFAASCFNDTGTMKYVECIQPSLLSIILLVLIDLI